MKLIQAVIRPEKEKDVIAGLEKAGVKAFTRVDVLGRGRQKGLQVGPVRYEELAKVWLMVVVGDADVERAVDAMKAAARTGNPGDGKVFVLPLVESRTIRTRSKDAEDEAPLSSQVSTSRQGE